MNYTDLTRMAACLKEKFICRQQRNITLNLSISTEEIKEGWVKAHMAGGTGALERRYVE